MFTATMIVIMLGVPKQVDDTRGPYATEPACQARLEEMRAVLATVPGTTFLGGQCQRDTSELSA